ncbi:MAG: dihydrofolate reductase [Ignavibacteriaceae bacterium]
MACNNQNDKTAEMQDDANFKYSTEQFADVEILRYRVPGFEQLTPKQKEMVYYLYEAALSGRDVFYDQNGKYNLRIRKIMEAVISNYNGDKNSEDYKNLLLFAKRMWFSNGIYHHYANDKFVPGFSKEFFVEAVKNAKQEELPLTNGQTVDELIAQLTPILFDPNVLPKKINLDPGVDVIKASAINFYEEGLTQKEVEAYYEKLRDENDETPVSHGLNSKMVKENQQVVEKKWMVGGMYSPAIEKIVYWLEKAAAVAENDLQKSAIQKLAEYYKTGDLVKWDEYNILWVQDTTSVIDAVNGFVEVYNDPLGYRGSYESVVSIKDMEATKRIDAISKNAQYFEDNSPIDDQFKKENVVGISAKVITVVVEAGDAAPSTPIGINLPNANWIRTQHGSKSVSLGNITYAYGKAASVEVIKEFAWSDEEVEINKKYGVITDLLHTDMHEVIGHASGKINPGVGAPKLSLKNYGSSIEETRADLVALYFMPDKKLIELGLFSDENTFKAEYNRYIRNGLQYQLNRVELGNNIEQAHMRNRQAIAAWVFEKGQPENVIERKTRDGKTFFVINDYQKLRNLFGQLLKEIQRITSEGDFNAAKNFIENYGVKVDAAMHKEVKERFAKLNVAPYKGFIQPVLKPVTEDGKIVDVKIEYPEDFVEQMLYYGKNYSFLPAIN